MWLASPGVNANSDNANFGPGNVDDNVGTGNNNFNSNGNWNANRNAVRPVDSIHCAYMTICYIIDNIETNHSPLTLCYKPKIDKYIC